MATTDAIRDRNHADLGELLIRDAEAIIESWAARAVSEGHGRPGAHRAELRDHLPEFLRALGEDLAGSDLRPSEAPRDQAVEHGRVRWRDGWDLADVVGDYQLLRVVILQYLSDALGRDPSIEEVLAIGVHIDDAIAEAVVAYVEHQAGQLHQAHRKLNEFLGVLGHELRNPLGTISVALQLARLCDTTANPDLSDAIECISRGTGTMTRLMDDMLDIARITRGDLEIRPRPVPLAELVASAVAATRPIVSERRHRLDLALPDEPMIVEADPTRMEQVFVNLLTNAAKYTDPGGEIAVIAGREGDHAAVRVRDNGAGIDPAFLPHLFELFAQAPEHNGRGLGIGLALVRSLVERHGGTITAHSDGPGRGSTFTVRLPLAEHAAPPAEAPDSLTGTASVAPPPPAAGGPAPRRVLVVEDERDSARLLALLLEQEGYEVRVAFDGASALAEARAVAPDLVLLDLGLPDLDGAEVARRLRAAPATAHTLIVALTGFSPGQIPGEAPRPLDPNFDLFLTKPVDSEGLSRVFSLRGRLAAR